MTLQKLTEPASPPARVLIADDDPHIRTLLQYTMERAGFPVATAGDGLELLGLLDDDVEVVLLDVRMPRMDGLECLRQLRERRADCQVIMITAHTDVRDAVEAIKRGAFDYITKPFNPEELLTAVRQAARTVGLTRENRHLRQAVSGATTPVAFIGGSPASRRLLEHARKLARLDGNLLLTGDSGVGKSLLARLIHAASPRADGPFVTVNCTTLPRELVESELFGHERGAFTGAGERRLGRLELADGGTLFLDEVGEMPLDLQPKLLTFLQERVFQRVGGNQDIKVNVRVLAATNQDLPLKVRERRFREDLFFRLNVLPLHVPPLRERREDIPPLAEYHLERIARRQGRPALRLSPAALAYLLDQDWPGNVRELENALEQAAAYCEGSIIEPAHLPARGPRLQLRPDDPPPAISLAGLTLDEVERMAIEHTLSHCGGNKARTARLLGISEKSIYNKIKRLKVTCPTG